MLSLPFLPVAEKDPDDEEGEVDDGNNVAHGEGGHVFANLIMMIIIIMMMLMAIHRV